MKKGNVELMKVWTNTEMGQTWEEDGETIEDDVLLNRRETYGCEVPEDVMYLTAGVDTQDDRFEIDVVGWGPEYESWGIKYAVIYGDNSSIDNQVWKDLDTFLSQTFEKQDGTKLKIICTCIDSGGHRTNQVYKFCKARFNRNIFAIRGSNNSAAAYIQKPKNGNREKAYVFEIGVDTGKSWLMDRLKLDKPGPGYCHFPLEDGKGYDEKYFKGLTSEKKVMRYKMGKAYFAWELKDKGQHKRNEALDCRNYATAAIEITNLPLKKQEEKQQQAAGSRKRKKRTKKQGRCYLMAGITLETAQKHLDAWLEAELTVTTGQSYTIGSRVLTRANLTEIRNAIDYWNKKVIALDNVKKAGGRNRVRRVVPRDL